MIGPRYQSDEDFRRPPPPAGARYAHGGRRLGPEALTNDFYLYQRDQDNPHTHGGVYNLGGMIGTVLVAAPTIAFAWAFTHELLDDDQPTDVLDVLPLDAGPAAGGFDPAVFAGPVVEAVADGALADPALPTIDAQPLDPPANPEFDVADAGPIPPSAVSEGYSAETADFDDPEPDMHPGDLYDDADFDDSDGGD